MLERKVDLFITVFEQEWKVTAPSLSSKVIKEVREWSVEYNPEAQLLNKNN